MEQKRETRIKRAWNAFLNRDPPDTHDTYLNNAYHEYGRGESIRPDRPRLTRGNEKSIITSVYNRIALDVASIAIKHVRIDEADRFIETIDSGLNRCLTESANIDQTGRAFIQDAVMSMLDEGCIALVPVDTDRDPETGAFDICSMRVGKILEWYPQHVKVRVYNEQTGSKEDVILSKSIVAIVENPLYATMNEHNSTMKRLVRKLNILDAIDEQSGSGKLDIIIQLPYVIRSEARRTQAENRRKDMESQLSNSKYGIAYADGTERITQLNRPAENNLMKQIEYLTSMLYGQLGLTEQIMNGTADEKTMLNYHSRTIEPILSANVDDMKRKFLSKTARSQKQTIMFFRDPFRLVPISDLAELSDKFTRNEILSSNEVRQIIGFKPSDDPKADKLQNSNIKQPGDEKSEEQKVNTEPTSNKQGGKNQNGQI